MNSLEENLKELCCWLGAHGCANCAREDPDVHNKNLRKTECVCTCASSTTCYVNRKPVLKYVTVLQELLHTKIQLCITCFFIYLLVRTDFEQNRTNCKIKQKKLYTQCLCITLLQKPL